MERGKKVQLEIGGKNPLIIAADADLEAAMNVAINGSYFNTQRMLKQYVSKAYFPVPQPESVPALEQVLAS